MVSLCRCGCGQPTPIAKKTNKSRGHVKGQPLPFLRYHNRQIAANERRLGRYVEEDRGYLSPCWIWQGDIAPHGYGRLCVHNKQVYAHRWMYEQWVGPIPPDRELDHLCEVTECVNPAHLEPVIHAENIRRGWNKITLEQAREIRDTHESPYEVAKRLGVGMGTAYRIRRGEAPSHAALLSR